MEDEEKPPRLTKEELKQREVQREERRRKFEEQVRLLHLCMLRMISNNFVLVWHTQFLYVSSQFSSHLAIRFFFNELVFESDF